MLKLLWAGIAVASMETQCHPLKQESQDSHPASDKNSMNPNSTEVTADHQVMAAQPENLTSVIDLDHPTPLPKQDGVDGKDGSKDKLSNNHESQQGHPAQDSKQRSTLQGKSHGPHSTAVLLTFHRVENLEMTQIKHLKDAQQSGNFDLFLLFDDKLNNNERDQITSLDVPLIPASKTEMQQYYGEKVYQEYSGIYDAPVKPMALKWTAESSYSYVWIVESDVVFTGDWAKFFLAHLHNQADLLATYIGHQGEDAWPNGWFWKSCTICDDTHHNGVFLSIHRMSNRFANDIQQLLIAGHTGHHEAFVGTCCKLVGSEHCQSEDIKSQYIGRVTYRPSIPESELVEVNKLYHPVKELKAAEDGKQVAFFDQSKYSKMLTAINAVSTQSSQASTPKH